jgi:hypothetical protein
VSRFAYTAPERLQFREGGGVLAVFGVPFFLAGIFLLLTAAGVLAMNSDDDLGGWARPLLGLMGVAFTGVGGTLVFGRSWTALDNAERAVTKSWGLLVPLHGQSRPLHEFSRVTLGFDRGDSDSSDHFPVALKARSGPDLVLCSLTAFDEARTCAAEAAKHLGFPLEDASGDHAITLDPADADRPLQQRAARDASVTRPVPPSAAARSEVHQETTGVRIVIPQPRMSRLGLGLVVVPVVVPLFAVPWLWDFFRQTRTPDAVGIAFLAMLTLFFGVLPGIAVVNGILRSRHGHTEVRVSRDGITVRTRDAWRMNTVATLDAGEILDVDYGTRETGIACTRRAVEEKLTEAGHDAGSLSPRMEWLMTAAAKWSKGRGVIVKSRRGLTTFGQDLDDDEIRYLHAVVRQALLSRT